MPQAPTFPPALDWLIIGILTLLPVVGLAAGPSYAPLIFAVAGIRLLYGLGVHRTMIPLDKTFLALGAGYVLLGLASSLWTIDHHLTMSATAQMAGVLFAGLVFYGNAQTVQISTFEPLPKYLDRKSVV